MNFRRNGKVSEQTKGLPTTLTQFELIYNGPNEECTTEPNRLTFQDPLCL